MIDPKLARFTILIIDDHLFLRRTVRHMLVQLGFSPDAVHEAGGAWEGVALAEKIKPSTVLCDVHMPGGGGIDFLSKLRALADVRLATTPVIMLTSDSSTEVVSSAKQQGIAGYLIKPVSGTALKRVLERVLKVTLP